MKAYIVIDREYGSEFFVTSIAVSSSAFNKYCVHTDTKIADFYKNDKNYHLLYIDENKEYFNDLMYHMVDKKDRYMEKHNNIIDTLNEIGKYV